MIFLLVLIMENKNGNIGAAKRVSKKTRTAVPAKKPEAKATGPKKQCCSGEETQG